MAVSASPPVSDLRATFIGNMAVHVTDGRVFDVRDERMAVVGETYFWMGFPAPGETLPIYDDTVTLPLDWIARVEILETAASPVT